MLNAKGVRELAYVVQVDSVEPMIGYDSLELATVNGWKCVVGKQSMKAGDLAVYFEIDSKLPDAEPFNLNSALVKYKFKIKTQRFGRGGIPYISQGLLMPLKEFGDKLKNVKLGDFLTEKLNITYYEVEDNTRKANNDKYTSMRDRHKKFFKTKFGRWLMRHEFTRKICFIFLGKKKDKKTDWPNWVVKTDEERCLGANVKIATDCGNIRIGELVHKRLPVKVKSYNLESGKIEYKDIVDYQEYSGDPEFYIIKTPFSTTSSTRKNTIVCTADHKFYTNKGYIKAKDLTLDHVIYREEFTYADDSVLEYIYGNILGDGHLYKEGNNVRFSFGQGETHADYVKLLHKMYNAKSYIVEPNGFNKAKFNHKFALCNTALLTKSINEDAIFTDDKHWSLTESFLNKLTWKSLALWYLDDGSFYEDPKTGRLAITLHTESYDTEENRLLINILKNKFGIEATLKEYKYNYLTLNHENSSIFIDKIKNYIPQCFKYKMPKDKQDLPCLLDNIQFDFCDRLMPTKILSIESAENKRKKSFDIEVADNHNFFANGVLTHNCQNCFNQMKALNKKWTTTEKIDGSSATYTMKNNRNKKKREMLVCSRNVVFNAPEKEERNYYKDTDGNIWLEMAAKYSMKTVLETILDNNPNLEFVTIQGEVYGGKIQKRNYGPDHRLAIFNVILKQNGKAPVRMNPTEMENYIFELNSKYDFNLATVPVLESEFELPETVEELLEMATGNSIVDGGPREGIVLRTEDGIHSFKAVSNQFLLDFHNN